MSQTKCTTNNKILIHIFSLNFNGSFVNYLNFQCVVSVYILSVVKPFNTNKPLKLPLFDQKEGGVRLSINWFNNLLSTSKHKSLITINFYNSSNINFALMYCIYFCKN